MENDDQLCGVCGSDKPAHESLNHEWSPEGILTPKVTEKKKPMVAPVDFLLRRTLIDKGLITAQDLADTLERIHAERSNRPNSSDLDSDDGQQDRGIGSSQVP